LRDELRQGGTQPNLNVGIIRNIVCPIPSESEQIAILEFLEAELKIVRVAIDRAEHEICLLREYRTRLVADVVTGKLDVRGAARDLRNDADEMAMSISDESQEAELIEEEQLV
jgi:type I restriction enzyme S subunit